MCILTEYFHTTAESFTEHMTPCSVATTHIRAQSSDGRLQSTVGARASFRRSLCEYIGHKCHILGKKIGRTRASAARGCANAAPAAMPPPIEAREGCSQLWPYG